MEKLKTKNKTTKQYTNIVLLIQDLSSRKSKCIMSKSYKYQS